MYYNYCFTTRYEVSSMFSRKYFGLLQACFDGCCFVCKSNNKFDLICEQNTHFANVILMRYYISQNSPSETTPVPRHCKRVIRNSIFSANTSTPFIRSEQRTNGASRFTRRPIRAQQQPWWAYPFSGQWAPRVDV